MFWDQTWNLFRPSTQSPHAYVACEANALVIGTVENIYDMLLGFMTCCVASQKRNV